MLLHAGVRILALARLPTFPMASAVTAGLSLRVGVKTPWQPCRCFRGGGALADAALETIAGYERRQQATEKARSEQLPDHLPRYEVKLDAPEHRTTCATHGERQVIGYDGQETREVVPRKLVVRRTEPSTVANERRFRHPLTAPPEGACRWRLMGR